MRECCRGSDLGSERGGENEAIAQHRFRAVTRQGGIDFVLIKVT